MWIARNFEGKLCEGQSKSVFREQETVEAKGYSFLVSSEEHYWAGYNSGKMEDRGGFFMENKIFLTGYPGSATDYEKIAAKKKLVLYNARKETTCEPEGYAKLYHDALANEVKTCSSKSFTRSGTFPR